MIEAELSNRPDAAGPTREADNPRAVRYATTERFLRLFGVESLADLPRPMDLERQ